LEAAAVDVVGLVLAVEGLPNASVELAAVRDTVLYK
jgi:hypothetical protein